MTERTQSFVGVRGHEHAQARLSRAIVREKLHHGLIFMGPRGVGKATLARGLACALHCTEQHGIGCGTCNTCQRILGGLHSGVEFIVPETEGGSIKVDTARELSYRLARAPFEGRHHVVVFDPADALTEQAYNALLKSIEEPQPGVHFVMLTTHPDQLLPTILSRCMPVRLGPLPLPLLQEVVEQALVERAAAAEDSEDDEAPPPPSAERKELALHLAQGSAGRALELMGDSSLDDDLAMTRGAIEATMRGPAAIFCGDKGPLWAAWTRASGGPGPGRPARERAACARTIDLWLLHLREHLRGGTGLPGLPAMGGDATILLRQLDRLQVLRESLERNPNVRLSIEQTLLELSA